LTTAFLYGFGQAFLKSATGEIQLREGFPLPFHLGLAFTLEDFVVSLSKRRRRVEFHL